MVVHDTIHTTLKGHSDGVVVTILYIISCLYVLYYLLYSTTIVAPCFIPEVYPTISLQFVLLHPRLNFARNLVFFHLHISLCRLGLSDAAGSTL